MEPVSASVSALVSLIDWRKLLQKLAADVTDKGAYGLLRLLRKDDREKAAKRVIVFFVQEFLSELEDRTPLSAALPGYHDQLNRLVEAAAPAITSWLQPQTKNIDLGEVERMWSGLGLDPLPAGFEWELVAKNLERDIRGYVRNDPALRESLNTALLEQQTEIQRQFAETLLRIAGPNPGFDIVGYRNYLQGKCAVLQLSAMHTSTYDRRVALWGVFVPQSARQSTPARNTHRELLRRLHYDKLRSNRNEDELSRFGEDDQSGPPVSVLELLERDRLVVILGDPGSGKTSLLKFLVLRWLDLKLDYSHAAPLPIWIDLKEYQRDRRGILNHCESGPTSFRLDGRVLTELLDGGEAAVYLDGLDEILDQSTRGSVVEEIATFAAQYPLASIVMTSRVTGYEPDRLRNVGFVHVTLEEFDEGQIHEFIARWHATAEDDPKERSRLEQQLEYSLRTCKSVRELAGNPLLLTMTAILNRTQPLPSNRVELYEQASRVLLQEWDLSRSIPGDTFARQEKEELLRELAGAMQNGDAGLDGNLIDRGALIKICREFLDRSGVIDPHGKAIALVNQLMERSFILCSVGSHSFSFVHRTFLEYFCAAWFVELFQKKQTITLKDLLSDVFGRHWMNEGWHEVLRLIVGMVGEKQAESILQFLMSQNGYDNRVANLMLAAACLGEIRNRKALRGVDEELRQRLVNEGVRYDAPYFYEPFLEYVEVGPTRERAVALLSSIWSGEPVRSWLKSTAEEDPDWIVRGAAIRLLARGWKDHPDTLSVLKGRAVSDRAYSVRTTALQELARLWKSYPETLGILKKLAVSDNAFTVRRAAVQEVSSGWKELEQTLSWVKNCAIVDAHPAVRKAAVHKVARLWKSDPATAEFLKKRSRLDQLPAVRKAAVHELAQEWKGEPNTLPWLKDRARFDDNFGVRTAAMQELARAWAHQADVLALVKDCVRLDTNFAVRVAAVQELGRFWRHDPKTLEILKDRARLDSDNEVRTAALLELTKGWKDNPDTILTVKELALSDKNSSVRMAAVREMARGWTDDRETLRWLQDHGRNDRNSAVRRTALRELVINWKDDSETLETIKDGACLDKSYDVRIAVLQELARSGTRDRETKTWLEKRAHMDANPSVRIAVIRSVSRTWFDDPDTGRWLQDVAHVDLDESVRAVATEELTRKSRRPQLCQ